MSKTPKEMAEVTTMNKQQQRFNQRFPYGRDSWRFAKARQMLSWSIGGELSLDTLPPYDAVEIPAEIVEHIYKMGWEDAKSLAREIMTDEL